MPGPCANFFHFPEYKMKSVLKSLKSNQLKSFDENIDFVVHLIGKTTTISLYMCCFQIAFQCLYIELSSSLGSNIEIIDIEFSLQSKLYLHKMAH